MTIEYVGLADYLAIAVEVTGLDTDTAVLAVASGDWDHDEMADWLHNYLTAPAD